MFFLFQIKLSSKEELQRTCKKLFGIGGGVQFLLSLAGPLIEEEEDFELIFQKKHAYVVSTDPV